jgi:hypothetical protein
MADKTDMKWRTAESKKWHGPCYSTQCESEADNSQCFPKSEYFIFTSRTVSNFMDCGFVAPHYKTLTFKASLKTVAAGHCQTANIGTATVWLPSCQWPSVQLTDIGTHVAFLSSREWKKLHGVTSGKYGGHGNMVTCCFGQAQSDVQACWCVATASSSCTRAQDAYSWRWWEFPGGWLSL